MTRALICRFLMAMSFRDPQAAAIGGKPCMPSTLGLTGGLAEEMAA
jgi:hypothetical protein